MDIHCFAIILASIYSVVESQHRNQSSSCPEPSKNVEYISCYRQCETDTSCDQRFGAGFKCCWNGCGDICVPPGTVSIPSDIVGNAADVSYAAHGIPAHGIPAHGIPPTHANGIPAHGIPTTGVVTQVKEKILECNDNLCAGRYIPDGCKKEDFDYDSMTGRICSRCLIDNCTIKACDFSARCDIVPPGCHKENIIQNGIADMCLGCPTNLCVSVTSNYHAPPAGFYATTPLEQEAIQLAIEAKEQAELDRLAREQLAREREAIKHHERLNSRSHRHRRRGNHRSRRVRHASRNRRSRRGRHISGNRRSRHERQESVTRRPGIIDTLLSALQPKASSSSGTPTSASHTNATPRAHSSTHQQAISTCRTRRCRRRNRQAQKRQLRNLRRSGRGRRRDVHSPTSTHSRGRTTRLNTRMTRRRNRRQQRRNMTTRRARRRNRRSHNSRRTRRTQRRNSRRSKRSRSTRVSGGRGGTTRR